MPLGSPTTEVSGYASIYLSDDLARLPVRAVTRPRDNKSDPNLETGTYGLFSTCQIRMRKSIVEKCVGHIFFLTTHRGSRKLCGYYDVGWFAPGPDDDYALAAGRWRFVAPIPVADLPEPLFGLLSFPRNYRGLGQDAVDRLTRLLDDSADRTAAYVDEIRRLEALSLQHTGFRYPTWKRAAGWSWDDAGTYLRDGHRSDRRVRNSAPDDEWVCRACGYAHHSKARLKLCPDCNELATFDPANP